MKPYFLGIAGGTASGKTFLAKRIAAAFPGRSAIIELDWYYRSNMHLSFEERCEVNYDVPAALDFDLIVAQLSDLKDGRTIDCPVYDFSKHLRGSECHPVSPKPLIIVEGILLLCNEQLRSLLDAAVFVDTPLDLRFERRLKRDMKERGRSEESVRRQWNATVAPGHERFCQPSCSLARLVVRGGSIDADEVIRILDLHMIVQAAGSDEADSNL